MDNEHNPAGPATPPPAPTPAEAVAAALRAARLARGYSLESVCQHTRISRKYLEALEAGRFDDLPAPVYLRSFLAGYCEYLDLDSQKLWKLLQPPAAPAAAAAPGGAPQPEPAAPHGKPEPATAHIPLEDSPYYQALLSSLGAVLCSLALAVALVVWVMHGRPSGPSAETGPGPAALQPLRSAAPAQLNVTLREEAWLSVKADGIVLFEGRAPQGARQQWRAKKGFQLRLFTPEDLDLTLNGAPYRLPRPDENGSYWIESP